MASLMMPQGGVPQVGPVVPPAMPAPPPPAVAPRTAPAVKGTAMLPPPTQLPFMPVGYGVGDSGRGDSGLGFGGYGYGQSGDIGGMAY
jgi:hypothetical protein